ncbi:MAG: hypothetical protein K2G55_15365 [Lachnospiraceae bacterium]|nr:hypothetical protein [Lachnospiraceae bacterium]MDE7201112.1 hypothetical protein [Lachnospiraceae bacterium]
MNKSDAVYEQKQLMADLIGCECFGINENVKLSDYDDAILEIMSMIEYNIDVGDKKEVAEWRRMLQQTKVEKRRAKKMIENNNRMEPVLT